MNELDRSLARDRSAFSERRIFAIVSGTNVFGGPFTSDELAVRFKPVANDKTSFNREGFINTVSDLKQPLFLAPLVEYFTNETDLGVADRLTIAISALATEDFHPRDFERIQMWWLPIRMNTRIGPFRNSMMLKSNLQQDAFRKLLSRFKKF